MCSNFQEAVYREQLIESKLSSLQTLLCSTQEASENSWQALIDEDRLLSRIEMLEGQLLAYSKVNIFAVLMQTRFSFVRLKFR